MCPTAESASLFLREVLQFMLYQGEYGGLRKFCFHALNGVMTVPYELETPLKVKVDDNVGTVWDKWFEWYSGANLINCLPAADSLYEDPNYYPTVYDAPKQGAHIAVMGICEEAPDANLVVKGVDVTGREIVTVHNGEQIIGEYLSIVKGQIRYTTSKFARITAVVKSKTNGYTQLFSFNPVNQSRGFLSDYSPVEELPQYRRYKLTSNRCAAVSHVSIIGRIRLKEYYADDDIIFFDNLYALSLAAQSINANYNNDVNVSKAKKEDVKELITTENEHKRVQAGQSVEVWRPTSGGAIKNIVY